MLVAALTLVGAASAATPFAPRWARWYNAESVARKVPIHVQWIRCGQPTGARRACDVTVIYKGRSACEGIVIRGLYLVIAARHEACMHTPAKPSPLAAKFWVVDGSWRRA